jgi:hypothetical protein
MENPTNLETTVREIETNIEQINHKVGGSWKALFRGILTGFGSVVGAALAIILIGWVLNFIGIIPAFRTQVDELRDSLKQTQAARQIVPND